MIPAQNIVAWGNLVPWTDARQIEQDLVISRALVEIFSDPMLRKALRFRGGTALNKLHFPAPLRYSEDIDLVRTSHGPIGPVLDRLRVVLEPWLGRARFEQSPVAPKFRFRVEAEDGSGVPIRLKIEINTREVEAFDGPTAFKRRKRCGKRKRDIRTAGCRTRSGLRSCSTTKERWTMPSGSTLNGLMGESRS